MSNLSPQPFPVPDVNNHDHPLDIDRIRAGLLVLVGATPTTILPDDTAATGTNQVWARSDHRHPNTTATAIALTRDGTSGEGVATSFARSDHDHSTAALPWGLGATPNHFVSTASSVSPHYATGATTDMTITNTVDNTRAYRVHLQVRFQPIDAGSTWEMNAHAAGTAFGEFSSQRASAGTEVLDATRAVLYLPASSGSVTIDLRVNRIGGTGNVALAADATAPRRLWMEDIGPQ